MQSPQIAAKLQVPRPRPDIVRRQRLHELMDQGQRSRLTLISAPAGFGKTTLLGDWLAARKASRRVAWVSLEQTDNEPAPFWAHLIAAVRGAAAGLGELPPLLDNRVPDRGTIVSLLNTLAALSGNLLVVLDDLHFIENAALLDELAFFVEHLSDNIHLFISTRADPPLALSRLRARGELTEIRSDDLRFRQEEAATYFSSSAHLDLNPDDVQTLEQRTEGWIAALQLAALSMRGRSDTSTFVANFAGSDRYVVDYLVDEVLRKQPQHIRDFLFGTAMLSRFTGPLCDAVLETQGSAATIDALDRQNLFIVALDSRREWYRYHHLFADVLLAHLPQSERDRLPERHRRASLWFEAHGDREEAIRHALAAPAFELAGTLIEGAIPEMRRRRRVAMLRGSIEALPDILVRARPVLSVNLVGTLLTAGVTTGVAERLDEAELILRNSDETGPNELRAAIEVYRSALAQMRGDVAAAIEHAQCVFELAPADAYLERAGAAGFLAIVAWSEGDLESAERNWAQCTDGLLHIGYVSDALGTMYARAQIAIAQGRLAHAEDILERGLALAEDRQSYPLPGSADLHVGLAEVLLARNDLAGVHAHLLESESADLTGMPQFPSRRLAVAARLASAEGDLHEASALLDEAARRHVGDFFPDTRPLAAMRARLAILQGDWSAVEVWQRKSGVTAALPLSYAREYELITLARFLLAKRETAQAIALIDDVCRERGTPDCRDRARCPAGPRLQRDGRCTRSTIGPSQRPRQRRVER